MQLGDDVSEKCDVASRFPRQCHPDGGEGALPALEGRSPHGLATLGIYAWNLKALSEHINKII